MLFLAGDINGSAEKLSDLRKRIRDLDNTSEYTEQEIIDLTKDLKRIKLEFAQAVNWLAEKNKDFS
jgi:predicted  nucleic acid-binding Zn-ribbon protein